MLTTYGLVTDADAALIGNVLEQLAAQFGRLNVLEIGTREGATARGIQSLLGQRLGSYFGIDNNRDLPVAAPFPGATMIVGDSAEVYSQVPGGLHFVFVDGCHCVNHVILDFLHYGPKVVVGGVVAFHDTNPAMQGTDYQGHGPATPDFHAACLRGIEVLNLDARPDWARLADAEERHWGGTRAYRRIA